MLKDDRMMGMLTFVVIMLAVGTFVQRTDFFQRLFGTAEPVAAVLSADVAEARVNERATIDVLANDSGVAEPERLSITAPPECGAASVRNGAIRYTPTSACLGGQVMRYGIGADGPTAELRITVRPAGKSDEKLRTVIRPGEPTTTVAASGSDAPPDTASGGQEPAAAEPPAPGTELAASEPEPAPGPSALAVNRTGPAEAGGSTVSPPPAGDEPAAGAGAGGERQGKGCTLPPTLTLTARPGAMTEVAVDAPCHRDSVAVLAYEGLRFAIPLDFRGAGSLAVPGFQRATEAVLTLGETEEIAFNLSFEGIERIDRIAIAWQAPAALALNAFEFGARPGARGHLTPDEPRSFEAVRRDGGGWLTSYAPENGRGQRIDVYSFWRRHAGPSGVVKLALDPGARTGAATCAGRHPGEPAGGAAGTADYLVLRAMGGRLERSRLGRIAPLDCTVLAGGPERFIENAVDDLIVRRR